MNKRLAMTSARRTELGRLGLRAAIRVRMQLNAAPTEALCVYDAAEKLNVEVRFVDVPSMEGMYVRNSAVDSQPIILVSALRPSGRQATTTAHELGHHIFGHGTRIDQYIADKNEDPELRAQDEEEMIANMFAGFFLMPKAAVERGFAARLCTSPAANPRLVFAVAGWLGVGYGTLIHHMRSSLGLLSPGEAKALLSIQPKRIRQEIIGASTKSDCFLVGAEWTGRPVDLQIGDLAVVARGVQVEGDCVAMAQAAPDGLETVQAVATGIGRLVGPNWATFVRVRPQAFAGRSIFRHLETVDDEG